MCAWATHCTSTPPEFAPVHESAPEPDPAYQSDPEPSLVQKSNPSVLTNKANHENSVCPAMTKEVIYELSAGPATATKSVY